MPERSVVPSRVGKREQAARKTAEQVGTSNTPKGKSNAIGRGWGGRAYERMEPDRAGYRCRARTLSAPLLPPAPSNSLSMLRRCAAHFFPHPVLSSSPLPPDGCNPRAAAIAAAAPPASGSPTEIRPPPSTLMASVDAGDLGVMSSPSSCTIPGAPASFQQEAGVDSGGAGCKRGQLRQHDVTAEGQVAHRPWLTQEERRQLVGQGPTAHHQHWTAQRRCRSSPPAVRVPDGQAPPRLPQIDVASAERFFTSWVDRTQHSLQQEWPLPDVLVPPSLAMFCATALSCIIIDSGSSDRPAAATLTSCDDEPEQFQ